jgi:glyoxylase-like metal-dependent hydrolase (beta-lactamase superfamily II)
MSHGASRLDLHVIVGPAVDVAIGGTFSPTTATILTGPTEAVLVDTLFTPEDVERLAKAIDATGKTLTTIYITHAHFDHYFGLGALLERFPGVRGVALPAVAEVVRATHEAGRALAEHWLPGKTVNPSVLPEALDGETISLDGHELRAIEVGQGDIAHSTVLHVPCIDAVVAGDVVYNGVHQMLGVSGPDDWRRWIESVGKIAALNPKVVIAGHKRTDLPDDDIPAIVDGTRDYISAFIEELADADDAQTLIARMTQRFPDRINPATLQFSAAAAMERKQQETAQSASTEAG